MSQPRPPVCGESDAWGTDLALGLLSGPDRAAALSHLAACPGCRDELDDLARVADQLLLLATDAEPPAGFESRILAAVGVAGPAGDAPSRRGRGNTELGRLRRRRGRLVGRGMVVLVAAALGGGVVAAVRSGAGEEGAVLRTGLAVSSNGRTSCRVVVTGSRPASVLVSLDGYPGTDTDVTVEMQTVTGATVPLGPLHVGGGHALLVRNLDLDADSLRLMRMVDREGRVVYEATLDDPARPARP